MTADEILAKARSYIGVITTYRMGANTKTAADCSEFFWRVQGLAKCQKKVWWNTDRICSNFLEKSPKFAKLDAPEPGCFGVWPGHWGKPDPKTGARKRHAGHIFYVVDPLHRTVIDCCSEKHGVAEHAAPGYFSATGLVWGRVAA